MRFATFALLSLLSVGVSSGFVAHTAFTQRQTSLRSLAEPPAAESRAGRSKDEIANELSSGRIMEGGAVIDFSAVKGESRAEAALSAAREQLILADIGGKSIMHASTEILGINQEVIAEVGHDLGQFADAETVQKVAAYMRSKAPSGFFETDKDTKVPIVSQSEFSKYQSIIRKAYVESGEVTSAFAKTFYMGTQLMPEKAREAIWAIYVWCRRTDEIVDAPRENDAEMLTDLSAWEMRLENLWRYGMVEDVFDLCLLDVRITYPKLSITPFVDMIRGMLMDVPDLGQDRYETFDELHLYCYRVAGTVGLMSMPIFGCAPGYTEDVARFVS
jgi:15-cis-phytoene synthase